MLARLMEQRRKQLRLRIGAHKKRHRPYQAATQRATKSLIGPFSLCGGESQAGPGLH